MSARRDDWVVREARAHFDWGVLTSMDVVEVYMTSSLTAGAGILEMASGVANLDCKVVVLFDVVAVVLVQTQALIASDPNGADRTRKMAVS